MSDPLTEAEAALVAHGLAFPEAHEAAPWGHTALKVKAKAFAFLAREEDGFSMSVKLAASHPAAMEQPWTEPTGYGLGKSGWVTARFGPGDDVPLDLLKRWLEESYRLVAPKKLAAALPVSG
jgi:predicted DNA-binding protein (MmcQ/YjbR family)